MVGLCAGRPSEWIIEGRSHPAVSICDFFVDARHGGRLLGRRLLRSFEAPGRLVNAISISDMAAAYLGRMGWRGPHASSLMVLPLPLLAKIGHALMVRRGGLALKDHAIAGTQMPETLKADLDRIDAITAHDAAAHMRRALAAVGFASPGFPLLGRFLRQRAPTYMWSPRGPGAALTADSMTMTFADSTIDLDL